MCIIEKVLFLLCFGQNQSHTRLQKPAAFVCGTDAIFAPLFVLLVSALEHLVPLALLSSITYQHIYVHI